MPRPEGARVYTGVDVRRGIARWASCYRCLRDVEACAARLREGRDMQEDNVQLFAGLLDDQPGPDQLAGIEGR